MGQAYIAWGYEQFLAYLYIHAASANDNITENEHSLIEGRVGEKVYKEVLAEYNAHSKDDREEAIRSMAKRFIVNSRHREDLIFDFHAIISADGVIDDMESAVLERIKELI